MRIIEFYLSSSSGIHCLMCVVSHTYSTHRIPVGFGIGNHFGINSTDFKKIIISKYNGFSSGVWEEICFKSQEDANTTVDWLNSLLVTKKLSGEYI